MSRAMLLQQTFANAMQYHRGGRLSEAESLYRQILQADSNHADALHMLGVLAHQTGRQQLAVEMIGRAIAQNGQVPAFHNNLGNAYAAAGKWQDAETSYGRALDRKRDYAEAHYNLGGALRAQGKLDEAVASYRQALIVRPNHAESYLNLSNALQALGKLEEAAEACQRAISLKPELAAAHNNLGNILAAQNRFEAAVTAYSRALGLRPDLAEAHYNRGLALLNSGRVDEAVVSCRQAVSHKPDYVAAYVTLGHALTQSGEAQEAVRAYQRATAVDPNCGEALLGCAIAPIPIVSDSVAESGAATQRFGERLDILLQWTCVNPGKLGEAVGRIQPFHLAYRRADLTAALCRYGDLASVEATEYWKPPEEARRRSQASRDRIRIAVVSGQVKRHPVWEIILRGLIAHLNTREFEVFLYHTGAAVDAETNWASAQVARFVQGPKPLQFWLTEIARARPDVIFYPEVGMDPNACTLAALRLAPLQIVGWGHPITSGLPTIDWFLSAELLENPSAEQHYREKLVRLPGTGVHTEFPVLQKEHWGGPERCKDVVRFALCQQPVKFDPEDDILLAHIAKAVGAAEFWLATPANMPWTAVKLRARISAAFRAEGLDPEVHLRTTPWLPRRQFLSFLDEMDIYLDCPAFSGYTTAWQALHCGLPIVTLEGQYLRQRLAAGLLRQVGATDAIALSREQYVAAAVGWANECRDTDRWAARRVELRRAAPRADGNRSAILAFEQKLREAFQGQNLGGA
jgi:predicted O-linked N-acetylglucosamine transferase (SPINDLY family)